MGSSRYPIYLARFRTQYELAATFLRFQEHYEGPYFRGIVFSLEEYMDWYAKGGGPTNNFTYYDDWTGFNIPSWVLEPFQEGEFNPTSRKELDFLLRFGYIRGDFYIIGCSDEGGGVDPSTIKHEVTHGLWYTNPAYRKDVLSVLKKWDLSSMHRALRKKGYHRAVLNDETNAYVLTGLDFDFEGEKELDDWSYRELRAELRVPFKDHFGFSMARISVENLLKKIHTIRFNR